MTVSVVRSPLFAELSLRGWFPIWVAVILGILAVATVGLFYFRESGRTAGLPRFLRAILTTEIESFESRERTRLAAPAVKPRMEGIEQHVIGGRRGQRQVGCVGAQAKRANYFDRPAANRVLVFVAMELEHIEFEFAHTLADIVAGGVYEHTDYSCATANRTPNLGRPFERNAAWTRRIKVQPDHPGTQRD